MKLAVVWLCSARALLACGVPDEAAALACRAEGVGMPIGNRRPSHILQRSQRRGNSMGLFQASFPNPHHKQRCPET